LSVTNIETIFRDKDISDKWERATEQLHEEFGISPSEVHLLSAIKVLFVNYVDENKFSEKAAIALYYRLVFFSMLKAIKTYKTTDVKFTGFKLTDLMPVFAASKQLAREAKDCEKLEVAIISINETIDALLLD
jgi:hypothetical protein